ncbi:hypothetical protein [Rhodococcus sp. (in: high G+C Gram-positive bacteria)]|uniref:hypothetical protein n=1 Tax=Rhodococcus sp. TaxID=1831 RepID=UPI003F06CDCA
MLPDNDLTEEILAEMREMRDWVSISAVLGVMGINSRMASREQVQFILEYIDSSDRLRLGRVTNKYCEIPKPLPVSALLDTIFKEEKATDRTGEMMQLFVDEVQ